MEIPTLSKKSHSLWKRLNVLEREKHDTEQALAESLCPVSVGDLIKIKCYGFRGKYKVMAIRYNTEHNSLEFRWTIRVMQREKYRWILGGYCDCMERVQER